MLAPACNDQELCIRLFTLLPPQDGLLHRQQFPATLTPCVGQLLKLVVLEVEVQRGRLSLGMGSGGAAAVSGGELRHARPSNSGRRNAEKADKSRGDRATPSSRGDRTLKGRIVQESKASGSTKPQKRKQSPNRR